MEWELLHRNRHHQSARNLFMKSLNSLCPTKCLSLWTTTVHLLKIRPFRLMPESVLSLAHDLLRPFKTIPPSLLASTLSFSLYFFLPGSFIRDVLTPFSCTVCLSDLQKWVVAFPFIIRDLQYALALGWTHLAIQGLHMAFPTVPVCPAIPPGLFFPFVLRKVDNSTEWIEPRVKFPSIVSRFETLKTAVY